MSEAGRALRQALGLVLLSVVVAAVVRFPLIKRFARAEFRETFFVAADFPEIRMITAAEAEDLWRAGEAFVDARASDLYREGHVPRALNAPAKDAETRLPSFFGRLPLEGTLVVYCEGGDCQSSQSLAKRLSKAGFRDIRVFSGGWEEWRRAGLPEEKGDDPE
ncbi:MAG TPA: rhodanese-like domain-containing protein [Acidobacteriota bacterium]|nr:rhodanese-like domain-containing protein [Acidobacteriota bacterium]